MRILHAIAWKTIQSAIRSRAVHVLLFMLLLSTVVLPLTIAFDGTAKGLVQVTLTYTLGLTMLLLSLTTVWLGCIVITEDIEGYQIHMVTTKPVSRVTFWLGKWLGLVTMQGTLLLVSSAVVLLLLYVRLGREDFVPEERQQLHEEVLVGRRVFRSEEMMDLEAAVNAEFARRHETNEIPTGMSEADVKDSLRRDIKAKMQEVPAGYNRPWHFVGLPVSPTYALWQTLYDKGSNTATSPEERDAAMVLLLYMMSNGADPRLGLSDEVVAQAAATLKMRVPELADNSLRFRYRFFVDSKTNRDQRESVGTWTVYDTVSRVALPQQTMERGGVFHEQPLAQQLISRDFSQLFHIVSPDGTLDIAYANQDPEGKSTVFQDQDGPTVLIRATGFANNYFRAVALLFLELLFLATLSCLCGSLLSTPVAVFMSYSYISIAMVVQAMKPAADESQMGVGGVDKILGLMRDLLGYMMVSVNEFNHVTELARGELIEPSSLSAGSLSIAAFRVLVLLVLTLIGLFLFQRRELGLVVRR